MVNFLKVALRHWPTILSEVLLMLCVPGVTRTTGPYGNTPLHIACRMSGDNSTAINRIIDHDPDALVLLNEDSEVPLHSALVGVLTSPAVMERMVDERPESLLCRNKQGLTPVEYSLWGAFVKTQIASTLRSLVKLCPASVVIHHTNRFEGTALYNACERFHAYPDLIEEVVRAHPPALCIIAFKSGRLSPLEAQDPTMPEGSVVPAFVASETLHMALAVVEYVLGVDAAFTDHENAAWFQHHVRETVATYLPASALAGFSGIGAARAVGKLENAMDVVRELFCNDRARDLLCGDVQGRNLVVGKVVVDLYRLNRMGRLDAPPAAARQVGQLAAHQVDLLAAHQVNLLASLKDSGTVESTFLHFRDVARHVLLTGGSSGEGHEAAPSGN